MVSKKISRQAKVMVYTLSISSILLFGIGIPLTVIFLKGTLR